MIRIFRPHRLVLSSLLASSLLVGAGCGDDSTTTTPDAGTNQNGDASVPPPPGAAFVSAAGGSFGPLGDYTGIRGAAQILRTTDGKTIVEVTVEGLAADTAYPVHMHALPCGVLDGGPHYLKNPAQPEGMDNEIWPAFTTNADGAGQASVTVDDHVARADAQSIVVHDPATPAARMACADLTMPKGQGPVAYSGTFAAFAGTDPLDANITGTATMAVKGMGTDIDLAVEGLNMASTYNVHVHELPCDAKNAGKHYKIDPAVADEDEANELWLTLTTPDAQGNATATLNSTHSVRADAQSVVIHRVIGDMAPKVACANLVRDSDSYVDLTTTGEATLLAQTYPDLTATATLVRGLDGKTSGSLTVNNLGNAMSYGAHVHTTTCALEDGSGHYKIDPTVTGAEEANELWLDFTTDADGAATIDAEWDHLARPEAVSVVIHDNNEAKDRLACIDLQ